jgi:hypothetical protein
MLLFWCSCVEYILWCCSCVSFVEFIYYDDVSLQSLYIMLFLWRFFVEFIYDAGVPLRSSYIILWRLLVMDLVLLCGIYDGWSCCLCSFVQLSCDVILVFLNITIQPKLRFFPLFIYREIWQSISDVISNCIIVYVNIQMTFHHKMKLQIWCFLLFQHDSNLIVVSLEDRKFP